MKQGRPIQLGILVLVAIVLIAGGYLIYQRQVKGECTTEDAGTTCCRYFDEDTRGKLHRYGFEQDFTRMLLNIRLGSPLDSALASYMEVKECCIYSSDLVLCTISANDKGEWKAYDIYAKPR